MKRRSFIQKTFIATAGLITTFHTSPVGQNKKLKMGLIGCGCYGMVITKSALKTGDVEVVALCDDDFEHLKNSADEVIVQNGFQRWQSRAFWKAKELINDGTTGKMTIENNKEAKQLLARP